MRPLALLLTTFCAATATLPARQTHPVTGIVLRIEPAHHALLVSRDQIPGAMAALEMSFTVRELAPLRTLATETPIRFARTTRGHTLYAGNLQTAVAANVEGNRFTLQQLGDPVQTVMTRRPVPWQIGPFTRPTSAPVIAPDKSSTFRDPLRPAPVHWESLHTFNPAALVRDGKVFVLYRAEDDSGQMQIGLHTSRLGLAASTDGIHFTRLPQPVFFPANDAQHDREWPGGVEDPRIVQAPGGTYVITYTQWNRIAYSIGIATSPDLIHWTKYGPAFLGAAGGRYDHLQYKSGGIVTTLVGDHLEAARIDGRFYMYWGEGAIHLATSPDLIHWTPVESSPGIPLEVLTRRPGHFDSGFPETGPPPVLTAAGIVMLYNGKNDPTHGDPALGANAYAAGEALFDPHDPTQLLARTGSPVLKPEQPFEKTGQYAAGTTFAEGLVLFHNQWFLYYGCADSAVGVATAPVAR